LDEERALREAGETRLADIIDALPNATVNDDHARVDAMVPEGLALAARVKNRWLEVFIRHWYLQSRVLHRVQVGSSLADAVKLVDLAHEEWARGCPQSVCAVQDLSSCYAYIDGPGFAAERLAVTEETLARIDPSWGCFQCISMEKVGALRDQGRDEEALRFIDAQIAALERAGEPPRDLFVAKRMRVLDALGRTAEALAYGENTLSAEPDSRTTQRTLQTLRAKLLAGLGRMKEATEALPTAGELEQDPSEYARWAEVVALLAPAGAMPNDWHLGRTLMAFASRLSAQGAVRPAIEVWVVHAELAIHRRAQFVAEEAVARIEALCPGLVAPGDMPAQIAALRTRVTALAAEHDAQADRGEDACLQEAKDDPERAVDVLSRARLRFPASEELALTHAAALQALGEGERAGEALHSFLRAGGGSPKTTIQLAELRLQAASAEPLAALAREVEESAADEETRARVRFLYALRLRRDGSFAQSSRAAEALLGGPLDYDAARLLAQNCVSAGDFVGALAALDAALARGAPPGPADWERMTAATVLGAWDKVRASAARLEIELSGEGEVDESFGLCRIELPEAAADGDRVHFALRTGPVTARILEILAPGQTQIFGDVWAFDAEPLNPPPEKDDEHHTWIYPAVRRLRQGNASAYELDGVHPGAALVRRLRGELRQRGGDVRVLSTDEYVLTDSVTDEEHPAVYARAAVPPSLTARDLLSLLRDVLGERLPSIALRRLAAAIGDPALIEEQEKIVARYGITD
jgi:tetratricopeptide (TPR) repeat protein